VVDPILIVAAAFEVTISVLQIKHADDELGSGIDYLPSYREDIGDKPANDYVDLR
jgi:hypothetical protein